MPRKAARLVRVNGPNDKNEIHSIGDIVEILRSRYAENNRILWFRGQREASWDVNPSIWRNYDPIHRAQFRLRERDFTNRFRARAAVRRQPLPAYRDYGGWLSLMQHYGLPTRLMDWSRSSLVAVYFAVEKLIYDSNLPVKSAALWILEPHVLNRLEIDEDVTPPIEANVCRPMLRAAFTSNSIENNKVCAAMSSETDMRMFVLQGCFTIHSDRTPLNLRAQSHKYLTKLVIPVESVRRVALEIDICGFRKGDLFPDLAELANEMTNRSLSHLV